MDEKIVGCGLMKKDDGYIVSISSVPKDFYLSGYMISFYEKRGITIQLLKGSLYFTPKSEDEIWGCGTATRIRYMVIATIFELYWFSKNVVK
jgi:hypothetical protein